jgi:hypothetical protein
MPRFMKNKLLLSYLKSLLTTNFVLFTYFVVLSSPSIIASWVVTKIDHKLWRAQAGLKKTATSRRKRLA